MMKVFVVAFVLFCWSFLLFVFLTALSLSHLLGSWVPGGQQSPRVSDFFFNSLLHIHKE